MVFFICKRNDSLYFTIKCENYYNKIIDKNEKNDIIHNHELTNL